MGVLGVFDITPEAMLIEEMYENEGSVPVVKITDRSHPLFEKVERTLPANAPRLIAVVIGIIHLKQFVA